MKKILGLIFILFLLPVGFSAEQFTIDVETAYTDPYPVEPGQNFVLSIYVTNKGYEKVNTVYIEIDPNSPFTVLEDPRESVSNLGGGGKKILEYDMFVDSSAISTLYEIPVKIVYGSLTTLTSNVQVRVQGKPQFEMLEVKTNEINPGDREGISVKFENVGTGTAKRLTATFDSNSDDITAIFSGGSVYIPSFKPGEKEWMEFDVLVDQEAEYGVYTGTITIEYDDESGNNHTYTYDVGILVSGEPSFDIIKTEVDQQDSELEVELINSGTAKGVAIRAELWMDGELVDSDYTTQVKINKKSIIKFDLPKKGNSGILRLSYKGPGNKEYMQEENIAWKSPTRSNLLLIILVLGIGIFLIWKKPWKNLKWFKKRK